MKTLFSRLITVIACFFIFSAAWFCLWSISLHLVERPDMAVLLFPFGLRLGLMLQCPRGYWPVLLGAEWLLIYWLMQAVGLTHFSLLMIGSLLTLLPVALISRYRHQRDWRTLLLQGAALTAAALLQSLPWLWHGKESWNALLLTLTGGLTPAPPCLGSSMCSGTISPITPGCRSARHWFPSRSTGVGGIWSGTCYCLLSASGSSWDCRTNCRALRHSVWRCRLSRWPGPMVGKER